MTVLRQRREHGGEHRASLKAALGERLRGLERLARRHAQAGDHAPERVVARERRLDRDGLHAAHRDDVVVARHVDLDDLVVVEQRPEWPEREQLAVRVAAQGVAIDVGGDLAVVLERHRLLADGAFDACRDGVVGRLTGLERREVDHLADAVDQRREREPVCRVKRGVARS